MKKKEEKNNIFEGLSDAIDRLDKEGWPNSTATFTKETIEQVQKDQQLENNKTMTKQEENINKIIGKYFPNKAIGKADLNGIEAVITREYYPNELVKDILDWHAARIKERDEKRDKDLQWLKLRIENSLYQKMPTEMIQRFSYARGWNEATVNWKKLLLKDLEQIMKGEEI